MDAFFAPFKSNFHAAAEQALAAQKQVLDFQRAQMKLVEEQTLASLRMTKAGFDASAELATNVTKSMTSAFAPKAEA